MMIGQLKIKILAIGGQSMLHRLAARLDHTQVSVRGCSSIQEIHDILNQEHFDLVIIDDLFNDTESLCQNTAGKSNAPVAIMCRRNDTDWKKFKSMEIDGYFPDEAGSPELMARIRAFSRRNSTGGSPTEAYLINETKK